MQANNTLTGRLVHRLAGKARDAGNDPIVDMCDRWLSGEALRISELLRLYLLLLIVVADATK